MDTERDPEKLRALNDELLARLRKEQARHNDELRQFAYAVSHDLREPLRMVSSYTQLLRRRYLTNLDSGGQEFVGFITEAVHRMEQLLADLLTYSHQFRPLEGPLGPIDGEAVLHGVLLTLENEIKQTGAQISHDPLPKVTFDFTRLSQVFRQLIANSLKFNGAEPPRIHISVNEAAGETIFTICDNGIGIDPRYHEQIFGIFRRLQQKECPGTGIGLPICKRIIEQQGGRIWVESETGQGARFNFTVAR